MDVYNLYDILAGILWLIVCLSLGWFYSNEKKSSDVQYKYFFLAFATKLFASIIFCIIYTTAYAGDTHQYYFTSRAISRLFFEDSGLCFKYLFSSLQEEAELLNYFNNETGFPQFRLNDRYAMYTSKICTPFYILGFGSYWAQTILLNCFTFLTAWKLYKVIVTYNIFNERMSRIALFYIPSVIFWGSGLLKDNFTLALTYYVLYNCIYYYYKARGIYILKILISIYFIIQIKPYIALSLAPAIIYMFQKRILFRIKNKVIKVVFAPLIITLSIGIIITFLNASNFLGEYAFDKALNKAVVTQQDLKREAYSKNSVDIGNFDASISGILLKAPIGIYTAFYKPSIFDITNIFIFFTAIENMIFFILSIRQFMNSRKRSPTIEQKEITRSIFLFIILFALVVGISTANYGALSRLRIPNVSMFLLILLQRNIKEENIS